MASLKHCCPLQNPELCWTTSASRTGVQEACLTVPVLDARIGIAARASPVVTHLGLLVWKKNARSLLTLVALRQTQAARASDSERSQKWTFWMLSLSPRLDCIVILRLLRKVPLTALSVLLWGSFSLDEKILVIVDIQIMRWLRPTGVRGAVRGVIQTTPAQTASRAV